jgi:hypothetical protein
MPPTPSHQVQRDRADLIAATLPGEDLPGWSYRPPGDDSWAPRLVHSGGAAITVNLVGNRLYLRGACPDGLSIHQWDSPEISVAADRARTWIVSNLNRRLVPGLLDQHARAVVILARQLDDEQAKVATCARLRETIPAGVLSQPWPADVHDARWYSGTGHHSGRVRVVSADSTDVELNSLTPDEAARVLAALFHPEDPARAGSEDPARAALPGTPSAARLSLAGFPQVACPDVSSALLPRSEFDFLAEAPTMVARFEHGAWVHTVGAGERDDPARAAAWTRWPHLRALLLHAADAGAGWVLLDSDGGLPTAPVPLTVHDW